jgi:hypothetical protein
MKQKERGTPQGYYLYSDGMSFWGQNIARNGEFGIRVTRGQSVLPIEKKLELHKEIAANLAVLTDEEKESYSAAQRKEDPTAVQKFAAGTKHAEALSKAAAEAKVKAEQDAAVAVKLAEASKAVEAETVQETVPEAPVSPLATAMAFVARVVG